MCLFIFAFTFYDETQRTSLYWGFGFIAACYLYYYLKYKRKNIELPIDTQAARIETEEI